MSIALRIVLQMSACVSGVSTSGMVSGRGSGPDQSGPGTIGSHAKLTYLRPVGMAEAKVEPASLRQSGFTQVSHPICSIATMSGKRYDCYVKLDPGNSKAPYMAVASAVTATSHNIEVPDD